MKWANWFPTGPLYVHAVLMFNKERISAQDNMKTFLLCAPVSNGTETVHESSTMNAVC
jgi:hypothetical protein